MSESKIKTTSRSLPGILASCLIAALALPPNSAQAQQIWFSPGDDLEVKGVVTHPDFMRLFDSKSPWPTGLGRVNVMQLRSPWFLRMPPDTDQKVVEFVKQHNVVKGSATVVDNVKMIRAYYPNIQFVWVEPPQGLAGGPPELAEVLDEYKTRLGEYPVSVRFDIAWGRVDKWTREWHEDVPGFIRVLKTRGIGYGIIYDAGRINGRLPQTDQEWILSAKANVAERAVRHRPGRTDIDRHDQPATSLQNAHDGERCPAVFFEHFSNLPLLSVCHR